MWHNLLFDRFCNSSSFHVEAGYVLGRHVGTTGRGGHRTLSAGVLPITARLSARDGLRSKAHRGSQGMRKLLKGTVSSLRVVQAEGQVMILANLIWRNPQPLDLSFKGRYIDEY